MRKRSRRSRLKPSAWMGLGIVASVSAGVWASPVTAVRKVVVEGAGQDERAAVESAVQKLRGVPCFRVDPSLVEGEVMGLPWIRNAELHRTPFGTARLRLEKRRMVARMFGDSGVGLAEDGTICRAPNIAADLPLLKIVEPRPGLGIASVLPLGALVRLAKEAPSLASGKSVRIDVDAGGGLCLNIGAGRVVLGPSDGLDTKLGVLRSRMREFPGELESVAELNLVAPSQPSVVPLPTPPTP